MSDRSGARAVDRITWYLTAGLGAWYLGFALVVGPIRSTDSLWYERAGDLLLAHWRDPRTYLEAADFHGVVSLFYVGFTALVGLVRHLVGAHSALVITVLNAVALTATAHIVLRTLRSVTSSRLAIVVTGVFFAACYEQFMWVAFVLSDTTFALLVTLVLYLSLTTQYDGRVDTRRRAAAWAIALVAALYRPAGVMLPAWLLAATALRVVWREPSMWRRATQLRTIALVAAAVGGLVAFFVGLLVMAPPAQLPTFLSSVLEVIRPELSLGTVVNGRPETYVTGIDTAFDVVRLAAKRVIYFFAIWADGFDTRHIIANALVYVPTYVLALAAIAAAFRRRDAPNLAEQRVVVVTLLLVSALALVHAVTFIDAEWRYRVPVYPGLFLLAGLGVPHVARAMRAVIPQERATRAVGAGR
jgi:hypothetical protein